MLPLAGPGSDDFGTPVSATVGEDEGTFSEGSAGLGATTADVAPVADREGIGAGAWFSDAGFSGGD